ncbi:Bifunctional protein FolD protein [subsurface metagenome]
MQKEKIIDGKKLAEELNQKLKKQIEITIKKTGIKPKLATILVGDNPASKVYLNIKKKICDKVNIESVSIELDKNINKNQLLSEINRLNTDPSVHGILLQLPLPQNLIDETNQFLAAIDPNKDVDGLHPMNIGNLFNYNEYLSPCTPKGIIKLLEYYNIDLSGKDVTIINRSRLVGKPLIFMLLKRNATISVCHTKTKDINKYIKNADILIVAVGKPKFIKVDQIKEGVVIIDVGITRIDGNLYGDADFENVLPKVSRITPVPGGVGPMTTHMLMKNTYNAYKNLIKI